MRTYTTTHTVYNFDELSDEAKQVAIEKQREFEQEYGLGDWLTDDMGYRLEELLKQHKIKYDEPPKVYYSLSYSQGDGAMFEGTVYWKSYTADIKQAGLYSHHNSKSIDLYSTKTEKYPKDEVYDTFNKLYMDICKELERYGYQVIEDALSDETLADNIRANGYEFYENGEMA